MCEKCKNKLVAIDVLKQQLQYEETEHENIIDEIDEKIASICIKLREHDADIASIREGVSLLANWLAIEQMKRRKLEYRLKMQKMLAEKEIEALKEQIADMEMCHAVKIASDFDDYCKVVAKNDDLRWELKKLREKRHQPANQNQLVLFG